MRGCGSMRYVIAQLFRLRSPSRIEWHIFPPLHPLFQIPIRLPVVCEIRAQPVEGIDIDDINLEEIPGKVETVKSIVARAEDFVNFLKQSSS